MDQQPDTSKKLPSSRAESAKQPRKPVDSPHETAKNLPPESVKELPRGRENQQTHAPRGRDRIDNGGPPQTGPSPNTPNKQAKVFSDSLADAETPLQDAPPTLFELPDRTAKSSPPPTPATNPRPFKLQELSGASGQYASGQYASGQYEIHDAHAGPPAGHVDPPSGNHSILAAVDPFTPDSSAPQSDLAPVQDSSEQSRRDRSEAWRVDPDDSPEHNIAARGDWAAGDGAAGDGAAGDWAAGDGASGNGNDDAPIERDGATATRPATWTWGGRAAVVSLMLFVGTVSFLSGRILHQPAPRQDTAINRTPLTGNPDISSAAGQGTRPIHEPHSHGFDSPPQNPPAAEIAGRPPQDGGNAMNEIARGSASPPPTDAAFSEAALSEAALSEAALSETDTNRADTAAEDTVAEDAFAEDADTGEPDETRVLPPEFTLGAPRSDTLQGPTNSLSGQELPVIPPPPATVVSYRTERNAADAPGAAEAPATQTAQPPLPQNRSIGTAIRNSETPNDLGDLLKIANTLGMWDAAPNAEATGEPDQPIGSQHTDTPSSGPEAASAQAAGPTIDR
jgi:hypothetical protein